jgi:hypothetical protein
MKKECNLPLIKSVSLSNYYIELVDNHFLLYIKEDYPLDNLIMTSDINNDYFNCKYLDSCLFTFIIPLANDIYKPIPNNIKYLKEYKSGDYIPLGVIDGYREEFNYIKATFYPFKWVYNSTFYVSNLRDNECLGLNINRTSEVIISPISSILDNLPIFLQKLLENKPILLEEELYTKLDINLIYWYKFVSNEKGYYSLFNKDEVSFIEKSDYSVVLDRDSIGETEYNNLYKGYPIGINLYSYGVHYVYSRLETSNLLYKPSYLLVIICINKGNNPVCLFINPLVYPELCKNYSSEQPYCFGRIKYLNKCIDPVSIKRNLEMVILNPEDVISPIYKITKVK